MLRNGAFICKGRHGWWGMCSNKNAIFYNFWGKVSLKMRGEIAGDILPAVKSCRGRHGEIVPAGVGTVKLHPPRLGGCSGGERITTWRWYKENGNYACGGGRDLLAWVG
jgi:hypothetical protein